MTKYGVEKVVVKVDSSGSDDDVSENADQRPDESTPLLNVDSGIDRANALERMQMFHSFRRRSPQKLSYRTLSQAKLASSGDVTASAVDEERSLLLVTAISSLDFPAAQPIEGLAPMFPNGGIAAYDGREYIPYREASLIKSVPAFAPYRRKARHRNFYLWWTNEFRHWWKSSRLLVRLGGLYVYHFDPVDAPRILLLDPTKQKSIKKYFKFAKRLGQGGEMRIFVKTVKPFTRTLRIFVGGWRWFEAAPCRRGEVGLEETMAFIGNRVSRMFARSATDFIAYYLLLPFQRYLFRQDILFYPTEYHPIALCVFIGIIRAVSPYAASFQGSRLGRVLTRHFFASEKNRWMPVQRISELNLTSDDCQEKDEVDQNSDLVIIARTVAKALGTVQEGNRYIDGEETKVVRQHEALMDEGFHQVGAGSGGYAVYQYHVKFHKQAPVQSALFLLHVTPYGPSITDVMPYYIVLEHETSFDHRGKWSQQTSWNGPSVLEGYCYQGAFFSPHHFAELKEMYDKQLFVYEAACKKLPTIAKTHRTGVPRDLPTLKKFLETGKRNRKRNKNNREYNELRKVVTSVANEIKHLIKKEKRNQNPQGRNYAPKGVILYFEGLDCSGKSSTGGLVQAALEQAGYQVCIRQYNRPPTTEQRARPWMDRFELPGKESILDLTSNSTDDKTDDCDLRIGLVWDRGPAGDFVYGNLNEKSSHERQQRFQEFIDFDKQCREKDILFLKLLFVTNRDSIAKTLGKRLAQKKMAKDLKVWLQACRSREESEDVPLEGLEAIEAHIDPTDFIAFNNYERNLRIFCNFALNTDSEQNPWVVVNTGDRYAARKALMQAFRVHLDEFQARAKDRSLCCPNKPLPPSETPGIEMDQMMKGKFKKSWRHSVYAWVTLMTLLLLAFIYAENTDWTDTWFHHPTHYNITELLEGGADDDLVPPPKTKPTKGGKTSVKDALVVEPEPSSKTSKEPKVTEEVTPTIFDVKKAKAQKLPEEPANDYTKVDEKKQKEEISSEPGKMFPAIGDTKKAKAEKNFDADEDNTMEDLSGAMERKLSLSEPLKIHFIETLKDFNMETTDLGEEIDEDP